MSHSHTTKISIIWQAARFEKMQIPTVAVNGDTWDSDLQKV
jgi:hypothetical protein